MAIPASYANTKYWHMIGGLSTNSTAQSLTFEGKAVKVTAVTTTGGSVHYTSSNPEFVIASSSSPVHVDLNNTSGDPVYVEVANSSNDPMLVKATSGEPVHVDLLVNSSDLAPYINLNNSSDNVVCVKATSGVPVHVDVNNTSGDPLYVEVANSSNDPMLVKATSGQPVHVDVNNTASDPLYTAIVDDDPYYDVRYRYNDDDDIQYVGKNTVHKASTSAATWDIWKYSYDASFNITRLEGPLTSAINNSSNLSWG